MFKNVLIETKSIYLFNHRQFQYNIHYYVRTKSIVRMFDEQSYDCIVGAQRHEFRQHRHIEIVVAQRIESLKL